MTGVAHRSIRPADEGLSPQERAIRAGMPTSLLELDSEYGQDRGAAEAVARFAGLEQSVRANEPDGAREIDQAEFRLALLPQIDSYWPAWESLVPEARRLAEFDRLSLGLDLARPVIPANNFRPTMVAMRRAVRLLCLNAVRKSEQDDFPAALADLKSAHLVANLSATSLTAAGTLETAGGLSLVLQTATKLISETSNPEHLSQMEEFLSKVETPDAWKSIRAISLASLAMSEDQEATDRILSQRRASWTANAGRALWSRNIYNFWADTLTNIKPFKEDLAEMRTTYATNLNVALSEGDGGSLGLTFFIPSLNGFLQELRSIEARKAVVQTFLDLKKAHPNGDWPAEASVALGSDPMTNLPLVYRRQRDGFVLYSAGANERDDSGRWRWAGRAGGGGTDIVITANAFGIFLAGL